jgi:hypothetical protein
MKLIYSTAEKPWSPFLNKFGNSKSFQELVDTDQVTFYYNMHHRHSEQNEAYWKYLEDHPTVNVIYDLHGEPACRQAIYEINNLIKKFKVKETQLIIIVLDRFQKIFVKDILKEYNITDATVSIWNHWLSLLDKKSLVGTDYKPRNNKFSFLLRRHSAWRLLLVIELLERKILWDNFIFSCLALEISCSTELKSISKSTAKTDLIDLKKSINYDIDCFLDKIPLYHNCNYSDIDIKENNETNLIKLIKSTDFHLLIEKSHMHDYIKMDADYEYMFKDGCFVSEKTYRVLISNRPFIVYSSQNWLKNFKSLGFKTYSPFINEEYDDEFDNAKRLKMIVDEVERICNLPADEYATLVKECQLIADYNYNLVMELYNKERDINLEQVLCKD